MDCLWEGLLTQEKERVDAYAEVHHSVRESTSSLFKE